MPISKTTISKLAGWTSSDVILQLEHGLAWAQFHGSPISGLVGGYGYIQDAATFGGTVGTVTATYRDIEPIATSGNGKGASFDIFRENGKVYYMRPNRPGSGYANGDTITISGNSIGGLSNGATNITFPIFMDLEEHKILTYLMR